jgi:hypothetical protein
MRLRQYITEGPKSKEQVANVLRLQCSKAIMAYREGKLLYRGMGNWKADTLLQSFNMRPNRQPRDTDPDMHRWMNERFVDSAGWPVRNGISVTPDYAQAGEYGWVQIFFPTNSYKYAYHPDVWDMWNILPYYNHLSFGPFDEFIEYAEKNEEPPEGIHGEEANAWRSTAEEWREFADDLDNFTTEKDESLADSIFRASGEIMFHSNPFYLMNPNHDDAAHVMKLLGIDLSRIKSASGNPIFEPASKWR